MSFEKMSLKNALKEDRDDKIFEQYTDRLKLTTEDLEKKILDVGSNLGEFANEAKRRGRPVVAPYSLPRGTT